MRSYLMPGNVILRSPAAPVVSGGGDLVIVVPMISGTLTDDEATAIDLLRRFGGDYRKLILHPEGMTFDFDLAGLEPVALDPINFQGISAYNAMLMSAWFYQMFSAFEHILIYQPDCLLLSDQIAPWLAKPWSYYGAPYFRRNGQLKSVGNGGFSLRRVADHLAVLNSPGLSLARASAPMIRQYVKGAYLRYLAGHLSALDRSAAGFVSRFDRAEDEFWIYYAGLFSDRFRLPPAREVVGFAAESRPATVKALNGGQLPLGAHAWARHDRGFWVQELAMLGVSVGH